ncbi:phosphoadenosine phosphosulfate reductase family protein [Bacillus phage PBC5]|nr:phosphoadenosine phosphosulfate reductase family protein [Bacillus phage PBC5]
MAKEIKTYLDIDVLTAAKQRLKHIFNSFDSVLFAFSGGKDSLATIELADEVRKEMGITEPLKVFFRDEEVIPDDVIDFVQAYYHSGRFDFRYYCIPLKSNKFVLGQTEAYVQWDNNREWIREKPEFAINGEEGVVYDQYTADEYITRGEVGKIAIVNGIRADESLIRLRACINKKNENYINASNFKHIKLCKPIYDWSEKDIFKFFYERNIEYCVVYNKQMWNSESLRVSTPLHSESAKNLKRLRATYPKFYEQLLQIFPDIVVQDRYWKDYDRYGIIDKYEPSFTGILHYINDHLTGSQNTLAKQRMFEARSYRESNMKKKGGAANWGGYPVLHVFKCIVNGQFKRTIQATKNPTKAEKEYEVRVAEWMSKNGKN